MKIKQILQLLIAIQLNFFAVQYLSAQKTDTIYLKDNAHQVGEIMSLNYGKLTFDTKYLGTPNITWNNIIRVISNKNMTMKDIRGKIYHGSAIDPREDHYLLILQEADSALCKIPLNEIVFMVPVKRKKIYRIYGNINAGFSFTKASDLMQLNVSGDIGYRTDNYDLNITGNSNNTFQGDIDNSTVQQNLQLTGTRNLQKRFVVPAFVSLEKNSELGIDLRTILGVGIGNVILQKPQNSIMVMVGPIYNNERYTSGDSLSTANSDQTTMEAFAGFQWRAFSYTLPELDFTTNVKYYYNLTTKDRNRLNISFNVKYEIIDDVYISLNFWDNFDSNPPSETASNNDWGTTTSIQYKFKGGQRRKLPKRAKKKKERAQTLQ